MARYIDADKLKGMFNGARPVGCAMHQIIDEVPTADVAPRAEVAREILGEIERMCIDTFGNFNHRVFEELKNKYAEGRNER